jgi:hypothetical protein
MFVEFDSLQDTARVWVFQAARELTSPEQSIISKALHAFTQQWTAHNQPLMSSFKIFYNQFVVLTADESFNEASGCSIDAATRIMQQLDQELQVGLFDRTQIAFYANGKVQVFALAELTKRLDAGFWNETSLVFNNVVQSKGELTTHWMVPAQNTWLKRYLNKATV